MAVIDIKLDPTPKDLRVFALLWLVFLPLLGWLLPGMGAGLVVMSIAAAACLGLSLTWNRDYPRGPQLAGLLIPAALLVIWVLMRGAGDASALRRIVFGVLAGTGLLGGAATLASPALGARLYRGWMFAVLPIGWTLSHALLGIVFFLVITPIGLMMRLLGRDPMQRRLDGRSASYWEEHAQIHDARRYFRQF